MEKLYSIDELVNGMINDYMLNMNGDEPRKMYQTKVYRALHETEIWEKGIVKSKTENGKKKIRYFTEKQKQQLFASSYLYDYITTHSTAKQINERKSYKELQKEIHDRRDAKIHYYDSLPQNNDFPNDALEVTDEELTNVMQNMMLKAIFELFYTPINQELLKNDLYTELYADEMDIDTEVIEAERRLSHPEGSYFKRKDKDIP